MKFHRKSLVAFCILLALVIFLGGFRFGRIIEKADKTFVPPTPIPTLTSIPLITPSPIPFSLKTVKNGCGFAFDYPSSFTIKKESSQGAELINGEQKIVYSCNPTARATIQPTMSPAIDVAPQRKKIANQNVQIYEKNNTHMWELKNNKDQVIVSYTVSKELSSLIMQTLRPAQ